MTEPPFEPWPLPYVWRILPADISDAEYIRVCDVMRQEVIDLGAPPELVKVATSNWSDGQMLAQAWQSVDLYDWTFPPVDPAAFQ